MPDLRVGTLDHMLTASVDLERLESTVESVTSKIIQALTDVLELKIDQMEEYLVVNGTPPPEFLLKFKWDLSKYPIRQTMKGIEEQIERQMASIDLETKSLHSEYISARTELATMERYEKGPLLTRNVSEFVKREDFVLNSEHLITVLVVVPKTSYNDWYSSYERLDNEVVPRSSNLLFEDCEYGLFNVTLFKRHLGHFKEKANEMRFFVKDFIFDNNRIEEERGRLSNLRQKKVTLIGPLVRALKINFSECYISYLHIKTMRIIVECVLRYGLPVNFLGIIMVMPKKNIKKLRDLMFKEFAYLDGSLPNEENKEEKKIQEQTATTSDYFPYVCIKVLVEPQEFK
ncbi:V-type proton ATPase subunit C 1-A isoform X2 [Halyomorpha halys]|nr:V-type proton ATPase subunit C 1-A-like isoform X2 [Halyomorpha halys]XP_014288465.1 V-type proton ATPase subunit C 1-A-like isoform X2 [Halyomorpha halys]